MACACQNCGNNYKIDVTIPNSLWEEIKPKEKSIGSGLLCGICIFKRIEILDRYDTYNLNMTEEDE